MVTISAPSRFDCTAASTAVMPPPITTTRRPIGSFDRSRRLPQLGDEIDGVDDVGERFLAGEPELVGRRRARCRGTPRRNRVRSSLERDIAAERDAVFHLDAADRRE